MLIDVEYSDQQCLKNYGGPNPHKEKPDIINFHNLYYGYKESIF